MTHPEGPAVASSGEVPRSLHRASRGWEVSPALRVLGLSDPEQITELVRA